MKKDLLIGGLFVVLAALGLGGVLGFAVLMHSAGQPTLMPSKPEPIAEWPKKEPEPVKAVVIAKKAEPAPQKIDEMPKVIAKAEPEPPKVEVKTTPIEEVKPLAKKQSTVKAIVLGNVTKLNDPDGEYTVKPLHGGAEITLLGRIKTLNIDSINERSVLDATRLEADDIVMLGNINSGSKVLLGKARTLKIREINGQSLLDASDLSAQSILMTGGVNSRSTLKLHAPKGVVEIDGEINDHAEIDIVAPHGKVVFKSRGDSIINGNAKMTISTKDLELRGAVNGSQLNVTFTKDGSLKFRRLSGGVRFLYGKAAASDPAPRIEKGEIDARAVLREVPAGRK